MAELQGIRGIPEGPQLRKPETYHERLQGIKSKIFKDSVMEPGFIESLTAPEGSPIDYQNISSVAGGRTREMFVDPMRRFGGSIEKGMTGKQLTIGDQLNLIEGMIDTTVGGLFQHGVQKGGFDPNTLHMFVGPKAKDIVKAEKMAMRGASPADIQSKMLMHKKPDGFWRKEISDEAMQLTPPGIDPADFDKPVNTLNWTYPEEALAHPEFKKQYPEIWDDLMMQVSIEPGLEKSGSFADYAGKPNEIIVVAPNIAEGTGMAGHELQHAVQQREGWTRGGSPEAIEMRSFHARKRIKEIEDSEEYKKPFRQMRKEWDKIKKSDPEAEQKEDIIYDRYKAAHPIIGEREGLAIEVAKNVDAHKAYQNLLGEREARSTAERLSMTLEERRGSLPDVGEGAQVLMR